LDVQPLAGILAAVRRPWTTLLDATALREARRWLPVGAPLPLRLLGKTLLHAALVGGVAGVAGAAFFAALEGGQVLLLEALAGHQPLRARGEALFPAAGGATQLRPWLLAALPALGGLASGLLARVAPEIAGGGGDATIHAYHRHGGLIRARVVPVKALASVLVLATGGAGGREGPTMQIGAGLGSLVGRLLPTSARERRLLVVAGVAAGISAVFRTPLGAALLAVEMLYRDDFESDALVPAILASVVAYSIVVSIFGEANLFGRLPRMPFVPAHLPLFAALALLTAGASRLFVAALRRAERAFGGLAAPQWAKPAVGGLVMGSFATALLLALGGWLGEAGRGLGVMGGGYGAVQLALTGAEGLPAGWSLVALMVALAAAKLVAAALTLGSGASAGDFAPSLVIGGLLGAAFGHGCAALLGSPTIQPAAFALVGMGTFYGGIAHVPLSALILVSELAGSYDLLVPMMLSIGIAYVVLRKSTLYPAQPPTKRESPVHAEAWAPGTDPSIADAESCRPELDPLPERMRVAEAAAAAAAAREQLVVPVTGADGRFRGLAVVDELRAAARDPHLSWTVVGDVMTPWCSVALHAPASVVARVLAESGLPQVPVADGGVVVAYVGEPELASALGHEGGIPLRRTKPL
jgi:CIC family chloride channel protein